MLKSVPFASTEYLAISPLKPHPAVLQPIIDSESLIVISAKEEE
jgi:hypothetical protein